MIPFAWSPNSKKWEFGYCSTNASQFRAIYLAGIDDAHYNRVDNIEKAAAQMHRLCHQSLQRSGENSVYLTAGAYEYAPCTLSREA